MSDKFVDAWFDSIGNLVRKRTAIKLSDGDFLDQITERTSVMSQQQQPSIGRVVHFVADWLVHVPADVCRVNTDGTVDLFVKDVMACNTYFKFNVPFDETGQTRHTWHWPEYVPAKA